MRERVGLSRELANLGVVYEKSPPRAPVASLPPQCAQPSPWPDVNCPKDKPSAAVRGRRIAWLSEIILEGVNTRTPHDKTKVATGGVFTGSWDWHSAVHGHWALLSIARVTGNKTLATKLDTLLDDTSLQAERKFLNSDKGFETPYGRAWLLLLLTELAPRRSTSKFVASFKQEVEDFMLDWLEKNNYPESGTTFNAAHDSWLFAYMLFVMSKPKSAKVVARLKALRTKKIDPNRKKLGTIVHTGDDFLYLPAVQAVIDRVDPAGGTPAPYPVSVSPPLADPPLTNKNAHSAGAALVRIWPYAIDSHAGDTKACARFHARLNEMFSRTDHWADSFEQVAHWVPQFMWMAMWLEAGRP